MIAFDRFGKCQDCGAAFEPQEDKNVLRWAQRHHRITGHAVTATWGHSHFGQKGYHYHTYAITMEEHHDQAMSEASTD